MSGGGSYHRPFTVIKHLKKHMFVWKKGICNQSMHIDKIDSSL